MSSRKLTKMDRHLILTKLREKVHDPKYEAWKKKALAFTIEVARRQLKTRLGRSPAYKGLLKLIETGYVKEASSYRLMVEDLAESDWRGGFYLGESKIHIAMPYRNVSYRGDATVHVSRHDPEYLNAKALAREEMKLRGDWERIHAEAKGLLQAAPTTSRLQEIWPELSTILPDLYKKHLLAPEPNTKALVASSGKVTDMINTYRSEG